MKVAIAAVSFALTCGLTLATPSAQGQSGQPAGTGPGGAAANSVTARSA